jgi:hypothetical protein
MLSAQISISAQMDAPKDLESFFLKLSRTHRMRSNNSMDTNSMDDKLMFARIDSLVLLPVLRLVGDMVDSVVVAGMVVDMAIEADSAVVVVSAADTVDEVGMVEDMEAGTAVVDMEVLLIVVGMKEDMEVVHNVNPCLLMTSLILPAQAATHPLQFLSRMYSHFVGSLI